MDLSRLTRRSEFSWIIEPTGPMRVPVIIYGSEALVSAIDAMSLGGAKWAVDRGYGIPEDLNRIEEHGCMEGATPDHVSDQAKRRQRDEMGTLGSGSHYLEVQRIASIYDEGIAADYGLRLNEVVVTIHCGSLGLGHQIGTPGLARLVARVEPILCVKG